jgi:hypothetical protein
MTFELGTLLIEYRRETTQKVTGFFCKICMKLWKMMILGFPPEQKKANPTVSTGGQHLLHTDLGYQGNT